MTFKQKISFFSSLIAILLNISVAYSQDNAITQTKESQQQITPQDALQMLKEGNQWFKGGNMLTRDLMEQVKLTSNGQYPYAVLH